MTKRIDLTGRRFGRLLVTAYAGNTDGGAQWVCACDCNARVIVLGGNLRKGGTQSCGCRRHELLTEPRIDLSGKRFGRWRVIAYAGKAKWTCACDCGGVRADIEGQNLREGKSRSCGCLRREVSSAVHKTHGMSKTPEYQAWTNLKQRCLNANRPDYGNYGGRGILPCEEWSGRHSFEAYFAVTGLRPPGRSLDRIDNDRGYEPGNVQWATKKQQIQNRRRPKKRRIKRGDPRILAGLQALAESLARAKLGATP
jgi:hypothetical protein